MKDNIDLTKILNNCPEGTVFWSDNYGEVHFLRIDPSLEHPIRMKRPADGEPVSYTKEGWFRIEFPASCLLWPSKYCRDWSKFTAPWYKKEKFDPKTLKPFDKVLARDHKNQIWRIDFYSHKDESITYLYRCVANSYIYCIPYNNGTQHFVGTTDEAPEYYRYWEN